MLPNNENKAIVYRPIRHIYIRDNYIPGLVLALVGRFEHIIIIIIIIKGIYIAQVRKGHKCAYAAVSSVLPPDESL